MLNNTLYEAKPYVLATMAFYALVISRSSQLMIISGLMLAFMSFLIISMRMDYRHKLALKRISNKQQQNNNFHIY